MNVKFKIIFISLLYILPLVNMKAQVYSNDYWSPLPTRDIYGDLDFSSIARMARMEAEAEAKRRDIFYKYYYEALNALNKEQYYDFLNISEKALSYNLYGNSTILEGSGRLYYERGMTYLLLGEKNDNLQYYYIAKTELKKAKKLHYSKAEQEIKNVNKLIKQQRKKYKK